MRISDWSSDVCSSDLTTITAIRDRSHWNIANIVPKDPVTLGLCSQRELDALVARAAKKAGIEAPTDGRLAGDREALIEELRTEHEDAARRIDEAQHVDEQAIEPIAVWIHPVRKNGRTTPEERRGEYG